MKNTERAIHFVTPVTRKIKCTEIQIDHDGEIREWEKKRVWVRQMCYLPPHPHSQVRCSFLLSIYGNEVLFDIKIIHMTTKKTDISESIDTMKKF